MTVMADFGILKNQITIHDIVEISSETKGDICQIIDVFSQIKNKKQEFSRFKTNYALSLPQKIWSTCRSGL